MDVRIPQDRVGVIIGKDGATKRTIEERSSTKLSIDSENGSVSISGDPINVMRAGEVVKAIARGFSPEKAYILFDDDLVMLEMIDLSIMTSTPKELKRIKGRIIGKDGMTRSLMESLTSSKISVYGKTVAIIGRPEQIHVVYTAINMLKDGSPHSHVYKFLEGERKRLRMLLR
jgi:ribosomal RNA assembly protein